MSMSLDFRIIENDTEWDEYVLQMPNYSFLNSSARYRYNVSVGAQAYRVAVFRNNSLLGIISASVGTSRLFGNFLECKHSPILRENRLEDMNEVLEYLKKLGKENNCFMVRMSPLLEENDEWKSFYTKNSLKEAPIHNVDALISQQLDLKKEKEELRRDMNKTKRNLLNRLIDNPEVEVKLFDDSSQFDLFADFHKQTVKLKGYTDKPVSSLLSELEEQVKKGMCYMLVGYYQGKPIGVWQCTVYGKHMHLYQAASDTEFRDKNINISYILFWYALSLGQEKGCEVFDLFGGVVPQEFEGKKHPWRGINDFKQSLGGSKVTYMHSRDCALNRIKYTAYYYYSWFRTSQKGYTIKW